ncbi:5-dehydro-2-deoxygluconokinase [Pantoea sp. Aalb]|uniref:bifunctional 5-dehydro-2-deoxygluconokinase/5-dehydro-2- deoxyphosphogluconate aldolase n=1 Tax=Pantoea sp. Aalb TaxID=2576762 RepID=UPI0013226541|nr:5-dehydro-2-deoxygluconokinase [Pantoea sp. Aalb]MXP67855.1 5-dehydro-2-deoxygluconokinase [Pantoea sp. Aalb]
MNIQQKRLDLICIGRIAIDLYGQQIGSRLEDMNSFAKYLGGSSGNVAYGTAIQGIKSAMLARVGDEHNGRFLREELQRVGCNTDGLIIDKNRLTGLVILGIKDEKTFPLIFYRDNCADMGLIPEDIKEEFIISSRALAVTGTHLSHPNTRAAVLKALHIAKRNNIKMALDIDYRPVLWGLTSVGDGETRFIESSEVTKTLSHVMHYFDLIVGTEEEFQIAGGSKDTLLALQHVRNFSKATLICKRGLLGCVIFENEISDNWKNIKHQKGIPVNILNVLGAGDAFMSGLLRGWLNNESWERACQYANACGALVVSRHGCAPAMPTKKELDYLLSYPTIQRPDLNVYLHHLHRVTTRKQEWPELNIFAFDHRKQFIEMAREAGTNEKRIIELKLLLLKAAERTINEIGLNKKSGILIDTTYGQKVLNNVTGKGWWIGRAIEMPNSRPLQLEHGSIGTQLIHWPQEHVIKCLIFYHPHDSEIISKAQDNLLLEVWHACNKSGHELLLEVLLPENHPDHNESYYYDIIGHFYSLGIKPDWWKLPPMSRENWNAISHLINHNDSYCRGILMLGLNASEKKIKESFISAAKVPLVKGFAIGRTIFNEPSRQWLYGNLEDNDLIQTVKNNFLRLINYWRMIRS